MALGLSFLKLAMVLWFATIHKQINNSYRIVFRDHFFQGGRNQHDLKPVVSLVVIHTINLHKNLLYTETS